MRNNRFKASNDIETRPVSGQEIDYSPKTYTLRDHIILGLKLFAVVGIIFMLFWMVELF
ncbi:hypothetical protein [Desulfococcus sp.]|uniref:hypothetical protein n=1 Tax=Desulfococcus sp. TaxID=2025834 RepID=UPI003593E3E2